MPFARHLCSIGGHYYWKSIQLIPPEDKIFEQLLCWLALVIPFTVMVLAWEWGFLVTIILSGVVGFELSEWNKKRTHSVRLKNLRRPRRRG